MVKNENPSGKTILMPDWYFSF